MCVAVWAYSMDACMILSIDLVHITNSNSYLKVVFENRVFLVRVPLLNYQY